MEQTIRIGYDTTEWVGVQLSFLTRRDNGFICDPGFITEKVTSGRLPVRYVCAREPLLYISTEKKVYVGNLMSRCIRLLRRLQKNLVFLTTHLLVLVGPYKLCIRGIMVCSTLTLLSLLPHLRPREELYRKEIVESKRYQVPIVVRWVLTFSVEWVSKGRSGRSR